jgi:hypothetical protein
MLLDQATPKRSDASDAGAIYHPTTAATRQKVFFAAADRELFL